MRKTFQIDLRAARKIDDGVVPAGKYKKFDHCCVGKPDAHRRPRRIGYPAVVMQLIDKRQRGAIFVCPAGIRTIAMDERKGLFRGDPRLLAVEGHMDAPFILASASRGDAVDHQLARPQIVAGGDCRVAAEHEASECKHRIAQPNASHHGPEQFQRLARRVGRMDAGQRGRYVCGVRWFEWCNARRVFHPRRRRRQVHFIDPAHGRTPDSRGSAAVLAIIDTHTYRPTSAMSSTISAGSRLLRNATVVSGVRLRASTSSSAAASMRRSRYDSDASAVGCKVACKSASARPAASAKPAT